MKLLASVLLLATAASCASTDRVPRAFVEMYDAARPDGVIEIELERDGTLREIEAEIPVEDVPEHVVAAAREEAPGARVTGAERELNERGVGYELQLERDGRSWELVFSEDGELLETEKELRAAEAPTAVLETAETALPGSTFKSVELITRGDVEEYHVKRMRDGASYKAVLAPTGALLRLVREARAELEVPLIQD